MWPNLHKITSYKINIFYLTKEAKLDNSTEKSLKSWFIIMHYVLKSGDC